MAGVVHSSSSSPPSLISPSITEDHKVDNNHYHGYDDVSLIINDISALPSIEQAATDDGYYHYYSVGRDYLDDYTTFATSASRTASRDFSDYDDFKLDFNDYENFYNVYENNDDDDDVSTGMTTIMKLDSIIPLDDSGDSPLHAATTIDGDDYDNRKQEFGKVASMTARHANEKSFSGEINQQPAGSVRWKRFAVSKSPLDYVGSLSSLPSSSSSSSSSMSGENYEEKEGKKARHMQRHETTSKASKKSSHDLDSSRYLKTPSKPDDQIGRKWNSTSEGVSNSTTMQSQLATTTSYLAFEPTVEMSVQQIHMLTHCSLPCVKCPEEKVESSRVKCQGGVSLIMDGCDCCLMCARQLGDMCDYKNKCDVNKGHYCDFNMDDGLRGICRARQAKSCTVEGKTYDDGETFQPTCNRICSCQNGHYACASLCPSEEMVPSPVHCRDPQLLRIGTQCCREWVCPNEKPSDKIGEGSMVVVVDGGGRGGGKKNEVDGESQQKMNHAPKTCSHETTNWSPCSSTCGVGWSTRQYADTSRCHSVQEKRMCLIRPCDLNDKHLEGKDCKNTWRQDTPLRFNHEGCLSVKEFRPKYCSTCKKLRCCLPDLTKTLIIDLHCMNRTVTHKLMWVKSCKCKESFCTP